MTLKEMQANLDTIRETYERLSQYSIELSNHIGELEKDNLKLRELLWATHPCIGKYGDDGELQCGRCLLDFKRAPVLEIEKILAFKTLKELGNNGDSDGKRD